MISEAERVEGQRAAQAIYDHRAAVAGDEAEALAVELETARTLGDATDDLEAEIAEAIRLHQRYARLADRLWLQIRSVGTP